MSTNTLPRIYLDNAATSWPKPKSVYKAVDHAMKQMGAPAGRSPYAEAMEATRLVEAARQSCAKLLGIRDSANLVFTSNGTDALNLAIHGLLQSGDHVVTTVIEHNSVLRPLTAARQRLGIEIDYVECNEQGVIEPADLRRAISEKTKLIVVSHASNVTGALQPIHDVAQIAADAKVTLLVDAAQTAGHLPLETQQLGIDLLATSGHKGLLGPLGTGLLYIRPGFEARLAPTRHGGTGTNSEEDRQPDTLPGKFESGNLNVPGIVGLGAGADYLHLKSLQQIRQHELQLAERLLAGLQELPAIKIYGPSTAAERIGLVSLNIEGYDPQEVAALLDASFRIQVRPGLHCAPRMHNRLGTAKRGGTVRLSFGSFTTIEDIDATIGALKQLSAG